MDFAHYQSPKLLGSSPPMTKKQGVSRESGTDFWRLSDISAKSGMVGKKQNPRSSGIFPTYENQVLVRLGLVKNRSAAVLKENLIRWTGFGTAVEGLEITIRLYTFHYCSIVDGWTRRSLKTISRLAASAPPRRTLGHRENRIFL